MSSFEWPTGCGVSCQAHDYPQTATGAAILHAHSCHEPDRGSSRLRHCIRAGVFRVHKGQCHLRAMRVRLASEQGMNNRNKRTDC